MNRHTDDASIVCRRSFGAFVYFAFGVVYPGRAVTPNWHIDVVSHYLERMVAGEVDKRLVLNQPPRSLKSFIVSVCFPAWILGQNPSQAVVVACYSDELSRKFSRECRTLMESPFYKRVFPNVRLSRRKASETEFETTRNGGRYTTSVGGTLTGRGADVLIIDDPMKAQDAHSELVRDNVDGWFNTTAYTRLNVPAQSLVIVNMQRLHANDLSGRLIEAGWPRLAFPAIATEQATYSVGVDETHTRKVGDLLQPNWNTIESLDDTKKQLGSNAFAAQYQQDPTPPDGNLIKMAWLARYDQPVPRDRYKQVVIGCDPAGKPGEENDYTGIVVAGVVGNDLHVLHVTRGHWTLNQMRQRIVDLAAEYRSELQLIEDTATGMGLIQDLRQATRLGVVGKHPKGNKISRVYGQLGLFESGRIILPKTAPWLADFEKELLGFPHAKYDDQVDALLLILEWFRMAPPPDILCGPIIFTWPRDPFGL